MGFGAGVSAGLMLASAAGECWGRRTRFPTRGGTSATDAGRSAEQVSECVSNACREKINGSVLSSDSNTHLVMLIKRDKMAHISIHLTRR